MDVSPWLDKNTIFLAIAGSHSYGLNTPESDIDEIGVTIPTNSYLLGIHKFEQANKFKDENGNKVDKTIYDIRKAIQLIIDNNPNMLSMLFYPERCIKRIEPDWQKFLDIRSSFLSKKTRYSFQGYAFAQLERIKTHRSFMASAVPKPFRTDYGLPEVSIFPETQVENIAKLSEEYVPKDKLDDFHKEITSVNDTYLVKAFRKYIEDPIITDYAIREYKKGQTEYLRSLETISSMYLRDEYREMASKEMKYLTAYKNWRRYEEWKKNRNPKRKAIEEKCGFDAKHGTMLLLLSRQAVEILKYGELFVDRTEIDRDELLAIKQGNVDFEYVMNEAKRRNVKWKWMNFIRLLHFNMNQKKRKLKIF
jgi:uncharacterized protein